MDAKIICDAEKNIHLRDTQLITENPVIKIINEKLQSLLSVKLRLENAISEKIPNDKINKFKLISIKEIDIRTRQYKEILTNYDEGNTSFIERALEDPYIFTSIHGLEDRNNTGSQLRFSTTARFYDNGYKAAFLNYTPYSPNTWLIGPDENKTDIPLIVFDNIVGFLHLSGVLSLRLLNKETNSLCKNRNIWMKVFLNTFPYHSLEETLKDVGTRACMGDFPTELIPWITFKESFSKGVISVTKCKELPESRVVARNCTPKRRHLESNTFAPGICGKVHVNPVCKCGQTAMYSRILKKDVVFDPSGTDITTFVRFTNDLCNGCARKRLTYPPCRVCGRISSYESATASIILVEEKRYSVCGLACIIAIMKNCDNFGVARLTLTPIGLFDGFSLRIALSSLTGRETNVIETSQRFKYKSDLVDVIDFMISILNNSDADEEVSKYYQWYDLKEGKQIFSQRKRRRIM